MLINLKPVYFDFKLKKKNGFGLSTLLYEEHHQSISEDASVSPALFRLSAKRFSLTYPRVDNTVTSTDFLAALKSNPKLSNTEILVCKENHSSSKDAFPSSSDLDNEKKVHFHSLVVGYQKLNIRQSTQLDVTINNKTYHGNYKAGINNVEKVLDYIEKAQKENKIQLKPIADENKNKNKNKDQTKNKTLKEENKDQTKNKTIFAGDLSSDLFNSNGELSLKKGKVLEDFEGYFDGDSDVDSDVDSDAYSESDSDSDSNSDFVDDLDAYLDDGEPTIASTNFGFFEKLKSKRKVQTEIMELATQGKFSSDEVLSHLVTNPSGSLGPIKNVIKAYEISEKVKEFKRMQPMVPTTTHTLADFKISRTLQEWIDMPDELKPTLIISGRSGAGKTRFVKTLAHMKSWKTVTINVKDGMHAILPSHQLIFFDDYFNKSTDEELLSLFTRESGGVKQHKIIYKVVQISGSQQLIFTMNNIAIKRIMNFLREERFSRRVQIESVPDDFLNRKATIVNLHVHGDMNIFNLAAMEQARIAKNNEILDYIETSSN